MSPIDWTVLSAYLVSTVALGLWVTRSNRTGSDVLLGGGQMGWFVVGLSLIATSMSASTFLGLPAYAYQHDFALLLNQVGALISVLVVAQIFIPRFRRSGVQSAYEILQLRFGRGVRFMGALFYCCHLILRSGILIFGPALVLSQLMGSSMELTICALAVISTAYTAFGGLKAVVLTDAIQFLVLLLGAICTLWILNQRMDLSQLWSIASEAGHTRIFPQKAELGPWIDPRDASSVLSAAFIYTVLEVAIRGCDQQFVQRYLACKDMSGALRSSYLSIAIGIPSALLFYSIGALLFAHDQATGTSVLSANEAYPHFIAQHIPSGLQGLLVAAIFAASMSSFDSAINALNNTTIVDLLGWDNDDRRSLKVARWGALPWGLLALVAALWAAQAGQSLLTQALYFTSLFTGPLLALISLAFFRPHYHPKAVLFGALGGMALLMVCSPPSFFRPYAPLFSWPYNPLVSSLGTWGIAAILHRCFSGHPKP